MAEFYLDDASNSLVATAGDDFIRAYGGNDSINGFLGNDIITGDSGDDLIDGDEGNDTIYGGDGNDVLAGDGGSNQANQQDSIFGQDGNDIIIGADSGDYLGGAGFDVFWIPRSFAPSGVRVNISFEAIGSVSGQGFAAGDNVLIIKEMEGIRGTDSDDLIFNSSTNGVMTSAVAYIEGAGGNDTIGGGLASDVLIGGAGWDTIYFGSTDLVFGGDVNVTNAFGNTAVAQEAITSGPIRFHSISTVIGSDGNDFLSAAQHVSLVYGLNLSGRGGSDSLTGSQFGDLLAGEAGDDFLRGEGSHDTLIGHDGNDNLGGGAGDDLLVGDSGNDSLDGGDSTDTLTGDSGNDTISGGEGGDVLSGGTGDDVVFAAKSDRSIAGGEGFDTLHILAQDIRFYVRNGSVVVDEGIVASEFEQVVSRRVEIVDGIAVAGGSGQDMLMGSSGNDWLEGGKGIDELSGGAGDDRLFVGLSDRFIDGGDGFDTLSIDEGGTYNLRDGVVRFDRNGDGTIGDREILAVGIEQVTGVDVTVIIG